MVGVFWVLWVGFVSPDIWDRLPRGLDPQLDQILAESNLDIRLQRAEEFIANHRNDETTYLERSDFLRMAAEIDPESGRRLFGNFIRELEKRARLLFSDSLRGKRNRLDQGLRNLEFQKNRMIRKASHDYETFVQGLHQWLMLANESELSRFRELKNDLLYLHQALSDSVLVRSPEVAHRTKDLQTWFDFLLSEKSSRLFFREKSQGLRDSLEREKDFLVKKAWLNRENAQIAFVSGLLAAQGICIVASFGICSATVPGTAALGRAFSVQQALSGISQGVFTVDASLRMADSYRLEGLKGLLSISTLTDILMIVTMLPSPNAKLLMQGAGFLKASVFRGLLATEIQSGFLNALILIPYGLWQIVNAKNISERLRTESRKDVSVEEIRNQGAYNLLLALVSFTRSWQQSQKLKMQGDPHGILQEASLLRAMGQTLMQVERLVPIRNGIRIVRQFQGIRQGQPIQWWRLTKDIGTIGYAGLFWHVPAIFAISNPDYGFHEFAGPLPELKEGEIAVTLNGFDPSDILYQAFEMRSSRSQELNNYIEGTNYFHDYFTSATDFFRKLNQLSNQHGKIRYLRIAAHGVPGKIATRALDMEGEEDFIDSHFISEHREHLVPVVKNIFAPDAKIILLSCLVGANLDKPMEFKEGTIPVDAGDQFARDFGGLLLSPNHGNLYTSRRIVMALDSFYGATFRTLLRAGIKNPEDLVQLDQLENEMKQAIERQNLLGPEDSEGGRRFLQTNGMRLWRIWTHIWVLIDRYGINIEGPLFGTAKNRVDHF